MVKPAKAYDVSYRARVHGRRSIAFAGSVFVCAMTHPACTVDDLATPAAQLWNLKSLFDLLPAAPLALRRFLFDGINECRAPMAGLGFVLVEQHHPRRFPASLVL